MSYSSKRTIFSMVVGVLTAVSYTIFALGTKAPKPDDIKSWAVSMLVFIGIGVTVMIVGLILFHFVLAIVIAVKEREQDEKTVERIISSTVVEDERDKLIGLKSARVGYACAGAGFVVALIILAFGLPVLAALHVAFGSFFIGSMIEGGVSIYHYERGIHNG